GPYGVGKRMKLSFTRAMITAAISGSLDKAKYETLPVFGLNIPTECPEVPSELLNPRNTWKNKDAYDARSVDLAKAFVKNFEQYVSAANEEILAAAPKAAAVNA